VPEVLAALLGDALSERLDLDRMAAVAGQSAAVRDRFRAGLRKAGLWF
jgi:hypothetical protein